MPGFIGGIQTEHAQTDGSCSVGPAPLYLQPRSASEGCRRFIWYLDQLAVFFLPLIL